MYSLALSCLGMFELVQHCSAMSMAKLQHIVSIRNKEFRIEIMGGRKIGTPLLVVTKEERFVPLERNSRSFVLTKEEPFVALERNKESLFAGNQVQ
jgi:hypothetical protein